MKEKNATVIGTSSLVDCCLDGTSDDSLGDSLGDCDDSSDTEDGLDGGSGRSMEARFGS